MVQQFACRLHQAKSNAWQQTISIHPSNNRGTENNNQNNFDANGNLLHLDNIVVV
jgi:insecticidal toxin complex protein TccC